MHISVQRGSRTYVIDTDKKTLVSRTGAGRPPSFEHLRDIIKHAVKYAQSSPVSRSITISDETPAPRPQVSPTDVTQPLRSDTDLLRSIGERVRMMHDLTEGATFGEYPSCIFAGGPGMGKSHTVTEVLRSAHMDPKRETKYRIVQGSSITPITLYDILYEYREKGNVLVLDDSDSVLNDESGMMLLKAALDSTPKRKLTWGSRAETVAPKEYDYQGSILFLTNQDFHRQIDKNGSANMNKRQQHLDALRSRSNYLDLMLTDRRAQWLWTQHQITSQKILMRHGLTEHEQTDVLTFMETHLSQLIECSIRSAAKMVPFVLSHRRDSRKAWQPRVQIIQFRRDL